jgi:hypothetical protein
VSKRENAKKSVAPGVAGPPVAPEPARVPESEEWAWMVDEDPAFYLQETGPAPEKRGG